MDADLVLEGRGVKGIGLAGACAGLSEAGYRFRRVAGVSAGAIVASLIAAGMPPREIEHAIRRVDYGRFAAEGFLDHLGAVGKGLSPLLDKGLDDGGRLHEWLDEILTSLGARRFGDLRIDDPGSSRFPGRDYSLVVMVSDITHGELVRLPWDYARYGLVPDDQLVADAVRASMSIPFFYEPIRFVSAGANREDVVSVMADGALFSDYPIGVFDRTDGRSPRWPTFGVKLSSRAESAVHGRTAPEGSLGIATSMVAAMAEAHDRTHVHDPSSVARTIFVETGDVRATDFDIEGETLDLLDASGRRAAAGFLAGWSFERYVARFRTAGVIDLRPPTVPADAA